MNSLVLAHLLSLFFFYFSALSYALFLNYVCNASYVEEREREKKTKLKKEKRKKEGKPGLEKTRPREGVT
jgi:hypothetical protein